MESSSKLQITLHSAKGLSNVKIFGTMDPYAVVWIGGDDSKQSNPCKTETAKKGASCPLWECCMEFNVAASMHVDNYTLFCDIKHDGKLFDREIGCVRVPFRDLLAGGASGEKLHYAVTNYAGEVEGKIILSHKFSGVSSGKKDATACKVAGGGPGKKDATGRKVSGGGSGKKVEAKKKTKKKKDGMMKGIAKKMAKQVASEVATAAVVTGILLAVGVDVGGDVDGVEDQAEEGVVDEEGDVDGEEEDDEGDFDGEEDVDQGDFDEDEDDDY